jgi:predicted house-cleaning NTP pyrophosphatase (Maf/HAM1 superfamily)
MIKPSPKMIKDYLASGEPLDKAGLRNSGASLVERVNGS